MLRLTNVALIVSGVGGAEVLADHRRDVTQRPLLTRRARVRTRSAPQQRTERIGSVQRAVAPAADVIGAAPVDELEPGRRREQHIAGRRAMERRPDAGERIGVVRRGEAAVARAGAEDGEIAFDAPHRAAVVDQLAAGREAELAPRANRLNAPRRPVGFPLKPTHKLAQFHIEETKNSIFSRSYR